VGVPGRCLARTPRNIIRTPWVIGRCVRPLDRSLFQGPNPSILYPNGWPPVGSCGLSTDGVFTTGYTRVALGGGRSRKMAPTHPLWGGPQTMLQASRQVALSPFHQPVDPYSAGTALCPYGWPTVGSYGWPTVGSYGWPTVGSYGWPTVGYVPTGVLP